MLVACWMAKTASRPAELVKDGIRFASLRLRVMLMRPWFGLVGLVTLIGWVIMVRMKLLQLVVGGCLGGLLTPGVIVLGVVLVGVQLFRVCIGFFLPLPGL